VLGGRRRPPHGRRAREPFRRSFADPGSASQAEHWAAYWDRLGDEDVDTLISRSAYREVIRRHVSPEALVLDAGCGLGMWVRHLQDRGTPCCAIDLDPGALRRLRGACPAAPLAQANVLQMPFRDGAFEELLSFGVLEHLEGGTAEGLAEDYRLLEPGGALLLAVPYLNPLKRLFLSDAQGDEHPSGAFYEYVFTRDQIMGSVQGAGFSIEGQMLIGRSTGLEQRLPAAIRLRNARRYSGMSPRPAVLRRLYDRVLHLLPGRLCGHMILLVCRKPPDRPQA